MEEVCWSCRQTNNNFIVSKSNAPAVLNLLPDTFKLCFSTLIRYTMVLRTIIPAWQFDYLFGFVYGYWGSTSIIPYQYISISHMQSKNFSGNGIEHDSESAHQLVGPTVVCESTRKVQCGATRCVPRKVSATIRINNAHPVMLHLSAFASRSWCFEILARKPDKPHRTWPCWTWCPDFHEIYIQSSTGRG